MKTKLEIIDEIASSYNINTLARDKGGSCKYLMSDGRMCGVGRCMTEEALKVYGDYGNYVKPLVNLIMCENDPEDCDINREQEALDSILKPEYRGHSVEFWQRIQNFHDAKEYWDDEGLSEVGKMAAETLKEKYKN